MMKCNHMITWPVIIKLDGDDELGFVSTQADWESELDLGHFLYGALGQMIDSEGSIYDLTRCIDGTALPKPTGDSIELATLTDLVRTHVSQLGHCCVSKLGFYSIAEAVAAVGKFTEFE